MTDQRSHNEFDSLESFFHERLKDGSLPREEGPWKKIEAELERMEKEKRRRRFFWLFFSGIVLLGGLAALWFFMLDEKFNANQVANKKTAVVVSENKGIPSISSNEKNTPAAANSLPENLIASSENSQVNRTSEVKLNPAEHVANSNNVPAITSGTNKIQLAACRKKADPAIFKNLPFAVIEVAGRDGYTRYFAETPANDEALESIRNAGFASAFVKKNYDAGTEAVTIKEAGSTQNSTSYVAANSYVAPNPVVEKKPSTDHAQIAPRNVAASEISVPATESKEPAANKTFTGGIAKNKDIESSQENPQTKNADEGRKTNIPSNNGVRTENPPASIANENPGVTATTLTNTTTTTNAGPTDTTKTLQVAQETKTDSVPLVLAAETKKDSVPQKQEAKDSAKTASNEVNPAPFSPEWALVLLAGPNIFTSQAQSTLYPTSAESQPISLNTELKLQYRPFKLFSFSGGVNYTTYSTKQDKTSFRFNKHQTSDYIFYSAFGPMAAPMSTLLEGYSPLAPMDTFPCSYSQSSKLNMINIPLEANLHLLSKSRTNIFLGLGANSSFAISQQSTLTLHKEHFDNNISYNKVTVSPFSLSLLFSLGCDVRVGKKLYLSFVPSYRYGLTNMSTTSGTTFSPAYFSGNAGLKFRF